MRFWSLTHRRSARLFLQVSLLFILGVAGLCAYLDLSYSPRADATSPAAVAANKAKSTVASSAAAAPSKPVKAVGAVASASLCSPDTSYQTPSMLNLSQVGLQRVIDTPSTYAVYGNSGSQIMAQIARCTPVHSTSGMPGTYAASTAYAVDWQFDYQGDGNTCALTDVKVGLHINQVFPGWQPSGGNNGMAASWQTYISKLHAYENGHIQLDEAEGAAVLSDLQNFPLTDCGSIEQVATAKVQADVRHYDQANADYDTDNNYGLNQGIIL